MSHSVESSDLVVFSHLRWDFVFQRPQHLMTRFACHRRVYFIEIPIFGETDSPYLHLKRSEENVNVLTPYFPEGYSHETCESILRMMLSETFEENNISQFTAWYYNPMALIYTDHLNPSVIIYDCMDELSGFKDCPQEMKDWESKLLGLADVVFTGGNAIYNAKKHLHYNIHSFPSSIDHSHFHQARKNLSEPYDQKEIPQPRIGFYGVIEERIDLNMLRDIAILRPEYQFIMLGPVIRLDESLLPRLPNIHYLGKKDYKELPLYLASWDCAFMPFALNEATRFISPTKTPEFLAAGKPVVSTPINDVIYPYASEAGLVYIAGNPEEFVNCVDLALEDARNNQDWISKVDKFLDGNTWDSTFARMAEHELKFIHSSNEYSGSTLTNMVRQ